MRAAIASSTSWSGVRFLRVAAVVAALFVPSGVAAQQRRLEIGLDGAVSYVSLAETEGLGSDNVQTWSFPLQRLRVGIARESALEPEVSMGFAVADFGEVSTVSFAAGASMLLRLGGAGPRSGACSGPATWPAPPSSTPRRCRRNPPPDLCSR